MPYANGQKEDMALDQFVHVEINLNIETLCVFMHDKMEKQRHIIILNKQINKRIKKLKSLEKITLRFLTHLRTT